MPNFRYTDDEESGGFQKNRKKQRWDDEPKKETRDKKRTKRNDYDKQRDAKRNYLEE